MYVLLNLRRAGLGVRDLVTLLERTAIDFLAGYDIAAESRRDAPGVYVGGAKIAALGLRISRGLDQIDALERVLGSADIADNKTAADQVGDELAGIFQSLYLGTQASAACNESVNRKS